MTTDTEQGTNEEKAYKLAQMARSALLKTAAADWEAAKKEVAQAAGLELSALNKLRTCGIKLQEAAGREQVTFEFFHKWSESLPKSMDFKAVKFCIHLARNFENPICTIEDARSARQMLFEAFGHSTAPKRLEEQTSHESNPWSEFVAKSRSFTAFFTSLETEAMNTWDKSRLSTFVNETQPVVDAHLKAKAML